MKPGTVFVVIASLCAAAYVVFRVGFASIIGAIFSVGWAGFAALVLYQEAYQPVALRYEVGEHSNFILVPMMLAALKQINKWKPENIQEYCARITRKPIELLREGGFWIEDENYRGHHLFGIRLPKHADIGKIKQQLQKNKISVSVRGDALRVSPNIYNSESDLMKLVKVLTN